MAQAYFKLEDFFTARPTRFLAAEDMDLYGGWKRLYSAREPVLDKPEPVDDEAAHELDRVQGMFAAEWLFFEDDAKAGADRKAYDQVQHAARPRERARPAGSTSSTSTRRCGRLTARTMSTPPCSDYLLRYWPLDYRGGEAQESVGLWPSSADS